MKWGGGRKISTFEAIIGLLIIAMICICICFALEFASQDFRSLQLFLLAIAIIYIISSVILWQIDLNVVLKESRSASQSAKSIWNIFQIGDEIGNKKYKEEKDADKKTTDKKNTK
jgi:hypothetical protein